MCRGQTDQLLAGSGTGGALQGGPGAVAI